MKLIIQPTLYDETEIICEVNGDCQTVAVLRPVLRFTPCGPDDYDKELDEEATEKIHSAIIDALRKAGIA